MKKIQVAEATNAQLNWLAAQGVPESMLSDLRVQTHRHAWLDLLIAEFKAKGD